MIFTGPVTQAGLIAAYRSASAFLCLSEHEGFCVPLLEAMLFELPVLAYDAAAVGETMRGGGILLENKDPYLVAEALNLVLQDKLVRESVLVSQRRALQTYRALDFGALLEGHVETAFHALEGRS